MSRRRMFIPMSGVALRRLLVAVLGVLVLAIAGLPAPARAADDDQATKAKIAELIRNLGDPDAKVRQQAALSPCRLRPEGVGRRPGPPEGPRG